MTTGNGGYSPVQVRMELTRHQRLAEGRRGRQVGAGSAADPILEIAVMVHPVVEFIDYPGGQADRRIDKCCSDCVGPCEHDLAVARVALVVTR